MTIYYTSNTHFGHPLLAVLRGFVKPEYEYLKQHPDGIHEAVTAGRHKMADIADVPAHDKAIIDNWNSVVAPEDEVWHLGDVSYRTELSHMRRCIWQLNGKIHLVSGNHDECSQWSKKWQDKLPEYTCVFADVAENAVVKINGKKVNLSHYPYIAALGQYDVKYERLALQDDGKWLLYGHTHKVDKRIGRTVHVGLDVWNLLPASETQIIELMSQVDALDDEEEENESTM
jgi:calcineurin-like phosphoesterase family protein